MDFFFQIGEQAFTTALWVAGPVLAVALVVGLGVGLLQAVTQIQELTLAFIPKVLAVTLLLFLLGPWMADQLSELVRAVAAAVAAGPR
jgi:flagellar biosynthetic protein FliQ